jgi:hypothetical protein
MTRSAAGVRGDRIAPSKGVVPNGSGTMESPAGPASGGELHRA